MATVTSREIVQTIIDNNGVYETDLPVLAVYEYRGPEGGLCWSLCYLPVDIESLFVSPYCSNIRLLWSRLDGKVGGMTPEQDTTSPVNKATMRGPFTKDGSPSKT